MSQGKVFWSPIANQNGKAQSTLTAKANAKANAQVPKAQVQAQAPVAKDSVPTSAPKVTRR